MVLSSYGVMVSCIRLKVIEKLLCGCSLAHISGISRGSVLSRLVSNDRWTDEKLSSSPTVALPNNSNGTECSHLFPTLSRELSRIRTVLLYETRSCGAPLLFLHRPQNRVKVVTAQLDGGLFDAFKTHMSKEIGLCHTCACLVNA